MGLQVNDEMANVLVAQILYLANQDPEHEPGLRDSVVVALNMPFA